MMIRTGCHAILSTVTPSFIGADVAYSTGPEEMCQAFELNVTLTSSCSRE